MPLEQTEPFHHSDRGERPHALLSNKQLDAKIEEIAEYADDDDPQASMDLLNELIQEHYNRLAENKIEPSDDSSFTEYEVTNQPVDEDFQDFHMSDDVFEQAWGIAKEFDFLDHSEDDRERAGQMAAFVMPTLGQFSPARLSRLMDEYPVREENPLIELPSGRVRRKPNYTQGEYTTQIRNYPEIFGLQSDATLHDEKFTLPNVPHYRIGTSRPRPIEEGGKRFATVNLPGMAQQLNYTYGDRIDTPKNLKYIAYVLAHEHGHAAIHDELKALGRVDELAHEFGAHTLEGLNSDEVQRRLKGRGLL